MGETRNFDELLKDIGPFGWFQIRIYAFKCLIGFIAAGPVVGIVFLAAIPNHWCSIPGLDRLNVTQDARWNISIPLEERDGKIVRSQCKMYDRNYSNLTEKDVQHLLNHGNLSEVPVRECKNGWLFDHSQYESTITADWGLVCENKWMHATASSVYMAGMMVGVVTSGAISDRYGRRIVMFVSMAAKSISMLASAFAPNYTVFIVLRFVVAATTMASVTTFFVLTMEMTGPSWRVCASLGGTYAWSFGYMAVAGLAYLIRDWYTLQLIFTAPVIISLITFCLVPESPRWLLSQGRKEEGFTIIRRMAKVNKYPVPAYLESVLVPVKEGSKATALDLVRTPNMRKKSLVIFYNWFMCAMVYYGLSLNTSELGGNDYINFLLSGAVEMPAHIVVQLALIWIGRKWLLVIVELFGGVALISTLAVPHDMTWLRITLAMSGKFCVSCSFSIIYLYSAEVYPTVVRNVGFGASSFCARIGGILAPYISLLSDFSKPLPTIVFGAVGVVAGLSAIVLPETKGQKLPETLEEGEDFGKRNIRTYNKSDTKNKMQMVEMLSLDPEKTKTFNDTCT